MANSPAQTKPSRILRRGTYRRTTVLGLTLVASLLLAACAPSSASTDAGNVVFYSWSGDFGVGVEKAFVDPVQAESGLTFDTVTDFNYGKFVNAMKNGNPENYDLVWFANESQAVESLEAGLIEPLDYSRLSNADKVIDSVKMAGAVSPYVTLYGLSYNTDALGGKTPTGWADFWNTEEFPGQRSLSQWVAGVLEAALLADGVAPEDLYPLDTERAYAKLDEIKPNIRVFHDSGAVQQLNQMVLQNEVSMALGWATDLMRARLDGQPVGTMYEGAFYFSPPVGIVKGSDNIDAAYDFLNQLMDPAAQAVFADSWLSSPSAPEALESLPADERDAVALAHIDQMIHLDPEYYAANEVAMQLEYDAWRLG